MEVTPGVWVACEPSMSASTQRTALTTRIAGTTHENDATPGSTAWIKAHLARMDDIRPGDSAGDIERERVDHQPV